MIQVCVFQEGRLVTGGEELLDTPGAKWIDLSPPTEEALQRLAARFGLHRLAIEDCLHLDQRPKLEEYPGHLFVVLQGFTAGAELCDLTLHEHHTLLGPGWLITVHELPFAGFDLVRRRIQEDPSGTLGRGCDFVAYLLADALVDSSFPVLDRFADELDGVEDAILEAPRAAQLQRVFQLKRMLVTLRRVLSPQRDVVGLLSRHGMPHVHERTTLYFRDVYDHLVRIHEQIDSGRDILGNALDAYLSMVANRTNDTTKQLTIFATIFLPLSFITGFFGQNFELLSRPPFFIAMLVLILALPLGLLVWFRRKGWH